MYRVASFSGKVIALEIESVEDDFESIDILVGEGSPVVIVDALEDAADMFNVSEDEIDVVQPE